MDIDKFIETLKYLGVPLNATQEEWIRNLWADVPPPPHEHEWVKQSGPIVKYVCSICGQWQIEGAPTDGGIVRRGLGRRAENGAD